MAYVKINGTPAAQVDKLLNGIFSDFAMGWHDALPAGAQRPAANIYELADHFEIAMNAPGRKKEEFQLQVENGTLTIKHEQKEETTEEDKKTVHREFSYKSFQRSFQLDEHIDSDGIAARYENGVLLIHLPKKEEKKANSKNIQIS